MKVLFVSNYLNGHQTEFCDIMYNSEDIEFTFLQTEKMDKERINLGWKLEDNGFPYFSEYAGNEKNKRLIESAEVIILGDSKIDILKYSLKKDVLILFYRERLFKTKRITDFLRCIRLWGRYALRYRKYRTAVLCASAYTAADFNKIKAFRCKYYKWGYFPEFLRYDIKELIANKRENSPTKILWVGRLIKYKQCMDALKAAKKLKENGRMFILDIVGTGEMRDELEEYVKNNGLTDIVRFHGSVPQKEVRKFMEQANVFVSTSNHEEGWGAVINEAMNSACAVIGSHAMGSVPYMIENNKNGLIYKSGDVEELCFLMDKCISDSGLAEKLGENAYHTVGEEWYAKNASSRLIALIKQLYYNEKSELPESGPCSKADILKDDWYRGLKNI